MTGANRMLAKAGGPTLCVSFLGQRIDPLHDSVSVKTGIMNDIPIEESSRVKSKHGTGVRERTYFGVLSPSF